MVDEGGEMLHRLNLKPQMRSGERKKNKTQCVRVTDVFTVASKKVSSRIEFTMHA